MRTLTRKHGWNSTFVATCALIWTSVALLQPSTGPLAHRTKLLATIMNETGCSRASSVSLRILPHESQVSVERFGFDAQEGAYGNTHTVLAIPWTHNEPTALWIHPICMSTSHSVKLKRSPPSPDYVDSHVSINTDKRDRQPVMGQYP